MVRTKQLELGGKTITVREMTVGEVRAWVADMEADNTPLDLVDGLLLVELRLQDLCRMTDLEMTDLDALTQTEIDQLLEAAKALNPHFFDLIGRLAQAGRNLIDQAKQAASAARPANLQ